MKTRKLEKSKRSLRLEMARVKADDFKMPLNISDDDIREFVYRFERQKNAKPKIAAKG